MSVQGDIEYLYSYGELVLYRVKMIINWDSDVSNISDVFVTFPHFFGGRLQETTTFSLLTMEVPGVKVRATYYDAPQIVLI